MDQKWGDDEAVHRLLAGDRTVDPELADMLADLRSAFTQPVSETVAAAHLARLRPERPRSARRSRRALVGLVAATAFLVLSGGLASADMLPAPVQDAYAAMVAPLGIDLPDSADERDDDRPEGSDPTQPGPREDAPGQGGSAPGDSEQTPAVTAPGPTDNPSVTAPGQTDNPSVTAPGPTDNPSVTAPGGSGGGSGKPDE